jgi:hypothetical protein
MGAAQGLASVRRARIAVVAGSLKAKSGISDAIHGTARGFSGRAYLVPANRLAARLAFLGAGFLLARFADQIAAKPQAIERTTLGCLGGITVQIPANTAVNGTALAEFTK